MRMLLTIPALALLLAGCGNSDKYAENADVPELATRSETPGDWSQLAQMVDRTPDESGLLQNSPISVDLNALLGPDAQRFREAMAGAGPLTRRGDALVTVAPSRAAFLVIVPADHALAAGVKSGARWRTYRTPGADVQLPPDVAALAMS